MSEKVKAQLLPPREKLTEKKAGRKSLREEEDEAEGRRRREEHDPLHIPSRHPSTGTQHPWLENANPQFV